MADKFLGSLVGGGIKSIQRGISAGGVTSVTISEVNIEKTYVNLLTTVAAGIAGSSGGLSFYGIVLSLSNSTTLLISRTGNSTIPVSWEVIEYE
jgi:hypothetical protein